MVNPGTFVVHDSIRPPLSPGDYTLTLQQAIDVTQGNATVPALDPATWNFRIVGPRFTLPKDQQLSVFPPPDSTGAYADRLPQIVLKRRTLPYERRIVLTDDPATTPPWLALVVLAEGEGQLLTNQPVDTTGLPDPTDQDAPVRDVLRVSRTVVQSVFPTLEDLSWLTHVREVDVSDTELALGSDGWMSVVVANRLPVPGPPATAGGPATPQRYGAFLISLEGHVADLPTAQVPTSNFNRSTVYDQIAIAQAAATAMATQTLPEGSLLGKVAPSGPVIAVATGPGGASAGGAGPTNVTPAGARTAPGAMGVAAFTGRTLAAARPSSPVDAWSLGTVPGAIAPTAPLSSPARTTVAGMTALRGFGLAPEYIEPLAPVVTFTVLANWSFTSAPEGDFRYLMQNLDLGMLGTAPALPAAPPSGAPPAAPDTKPSMVVLYTGHLAVDGVSRAGAAVTSWFRGPLTPQAVARPDATDPNGVLAWAADQLRRIGPDGREEVSLAVAFELGRAMAAAQPGVIAALLAWRTAGYSVSRLAALVAGGGTPLHAQLASLLAQEKPDFSAAVAAELLSSVGAPNLGPVCVEGSPPSVVPVGQDLAQTIAQGFGLDPAAVSVLLGDASVPVTSGLPASATAPVVPQSLGQLGQADFMAVGALTVAAATRIARQVSAVQPVFQPPVLSRPVGSIGSPLLGKLRAQAPDAQAIEAPSVAGGAATRPTGVGLRVEAGPGAAATVLRAATTVGSPETATEVPPETAP